MDAKIDRARKNLAFPVSRESPPWDLTPRHNPSRAHVCAHTQRGEFSREGSRLKGCKGNLLSCTVHQGRARQISRPIRVLIHLDRGRYAYYSSPCCFESRNKCSTVSIRVSRGFLFVEILVNIFRFDVRK